jgi:hypothetical protein
VIRADFLPSSLAQRAGLFFISSTMRLILLTGALACGAACAQTTAAPPADGWTVYSDVSVWQASDAVPISQIGGRWTAYSPRPGRNTALMRSRAAAGVGKNRWRLGVELRQDAFLATDRDSLDTYSMFQQKSKPTPPASFAAQAQYFSWRAQGLRLGYSFDGPRIGARASFIELSGAVYGKQRLRERSVRGALTYPQANVYGFSATHIDASSRMTYPFMGDAPSASGAGLSLALTLPLLDAWTLRVQADDLASRLRWKNLPVNSESLNSNVTRYDANGYVNYQPLLSGRRQQVERSFSIPRHTAATLDYQYQDWGASVQVARYAGETIPTFSLSRRFGWLTLRANVETRFDSAGIGVEAGNFSLMLQSDAFKLNEAKTRSLQLHYHVDF